LGKTQNLKSETRNAILQELLKKLLHIDKAAVRAQNRLPESITYDEVTIKKAQDTLNLLKVLNK